MLFYYLSIDPGTNSLGLTINAVNFATKEKKIVHSYTAHIDKLAQLLYGDSLVLTQGLRFAKMQVCRDVIFKMACEWEIQAVVSESPYMGRFPQAFSALVECIQAMHLGIMDYNSLMPFNLIDPATVKKAMGVKGNSGDKNAMRNAVANILPAEFDINYFDEHAIDSMGVGHAFYIANILTRV